ncbi:MAG: ABC transporter ATP-binding protein [Bacteroidota bacterium]
MRNILEVYNLSKLYDGKVLAISNCSFQLEEGGICAVVGESGSGKSTLLRLIAGLERPTTGHIIIDENIVSNDTSILPPQDRQVGFVFQNFTLFPHMTVEQNIAFGLKTNKKETIQNLLKLIKMEGYEKSYPSQLSGGQEQRVALARTLAVRPKLLLLDEPFSNLDASLKSELRQEIRSIAKELGASMIFITHDIVDAIDIAEHILLLKDGLVVEYKPVEKFAKENQNEEVKTLIQELKTSVDTILKFIN